MSIVPFTGKPIVSFDELDREMDAQEAAEAVRDGFEFDLENVEHRAKAINGALSTIDFTPCTGAEFWSVYTCPTGRQVAIEWARKAKAKIDDIVASYPG